MFTNEMLIEFGKRTRVKFIVESEEALSKFHALGAIEVATHKLISENQALIDSHPDC